MKSSRSLRIMFFGIGLIAVVALTGMNVFSLYELRESTIETAHENKKNQIEEFTTQVRHRFYEPSRGIRKLDIEHLQNYYNEHGSFPQYFNDVLYEVSQDSIYGDIYYSPYNSDHCRNPAEPMYKYNPDTKSFITPDNVPEQVCDGLGLAKSRIKVLIDDYRWNNKATIDTHRSLTLSLINLDDKEAFGHLTFVVNRDYLVNEYMGKELEKKFGPAEETGIVVWLRDFMVGEILASSDTIENYDRSTQIDIRQRFPELLDNWVLHAKIIESPTIAASNASLTRNLLVLGSAVLALLGALIFMYFTAKRERELAQRQAGFLANVTHEFKTPLATMQAAGENLSDGRITNSTSIKTYGSHIYNESIRLKKMIEKLLDIARIDAGQSTVQLIPQEPGTLLQIYYENHFNYVASKGFKFELNVAPDLPEILIDSDHFETVIGNLIDNSIKYSNEKREIILGVQMREEQVAFLVRDSGIGISKKAQKQIFKKFYRIEDTLTAKTKGHGLGLSIVENLIRLNHGKILVQSAPGEGTLFILLFPIAGMNGQAESSSQIHHDNVKNEAKAPGYAIK